MAGSTPGPDRYYQAVGQITYRDEKRRLDVYRKRAQAAGIPLNRYLAQVLAAAHDLTDTADEPAQQQLPYADAAGA